MGWPLSQDYNEAIQNPAQCLTDPDLRTGRPVLDRLGLPRPCSGNFADVYQIRAPSGASAWAVKCFTREVPDRQDRYQAVSDHLATIRAPYFVEFVSLPQGILVKGRWYPVLKMAWVEGVLLSTAVSDRLGHPAALRELAGQWVELAAALRRAGVAHGDLQHGNVLVVPAPGGRSVLRLVDYDGMWVPGLAGVKASEVGHRDYQHPQRVDQELFDPEVDRFPHLVIYAALRALEVGGAGLWKRYDNGDNLLFRAADFRDPAASPLLRELWGAPDPEVRALAGHLALACVSPPGGSPWLEDLAGPGRTPALSPSQERMLAALMGSPGWTASTSARAPRPQPVAPAPTPRTAGPRPVPLPSPVPAPPAPVGLVPRVPVGHVWSAAVRALRLFARRHPAWTAFGLLVLVSGLWGAFPGARAPTKPQTRPAIAESPRRVEPPPVAQGGGPGEVGPTTTLGSRSGAPAEPPASTTSSPSPRPTEPPVPEPTFTIERPDVAVLDDELRVIDDAIAVEEATLREAQKCIDDFKDGSVLHPGIPMTPTIDRVSFTFTYSPAAQKASTSLAELQKARSENLSRREQAARQATVEVHGLAERKSKEDGFRRERLRLMERMIETLREEMRLLDDELRSLDQQMAGYEAELGKRYEWNRERRGVPNHGAADTWVDHAEVEQTRLRDADFKRRMNRFAFTLKRRRVEWLRNQVRSLQGDPALSAGGRSASALSPSGLAAMTAPGAPGSRLPTAGPEPSFTLVGPLPENLDDELKEIDDGIAEEERRLRGIEERLTAIAAEQFANVFWQSRAVAEEEQSKGKKRLDVLKRAREVNRAARARAEADARIEIHGQAEKQRQESVIREQRVRFLEGRIQAIEGSLKQLERELPPLEEWVERCRANLETFKDFKWRYELLSAELKVRVNRETDKPKRRRLEEYRNELRKLQADGSIWSVPTGSG
jgi:hypothetical protein